MNNDPTLSFETLLDLAKIGSFPDDYPPPRLAVIGYPVAHSLSPGMHQAALDAQGRDMRYVRIEVPPGAVAEAFAAMHELGFVGCNVTVPHKQEALEACTEVHEAAQLVGAVNTIIFRPAGLEGTNTDGTGLATAVEESFGRPLSAHRVALRDADLLINATSLGLRADDPIPISPSTLHPGLAVYDMIYNPPETPLLAAARATGCRTANGLTMLLHQGAHAYVHWFGPPAPVDDMRRGLQTTC